MSSSDSTLPMQEGAMSAQAMSAQEGAMSAQAMSAQEGAPAELAPISIMDKPTVSTADADLNETPATQRAHAPEQEVALDMLKRSAFFAAPLLAAATIGWRWEGLASAALALALVLVNLMLGAASITLGARIGGSALMAAVLGGYLLRLGIITITVLPIAHHDWFQPVPFAVSLLVTHLGLLAIESKHISLSAAYPGVKPSLRKSEPHSRGNLEPGSSDSVSLNPFSLQSRERIT